MSSIFDICLPSKAGVYLQDSEPNRPYSGALWISATTGLIKRWDGSTWNLFIQEYADDAAAAAAGVALGGLYHTAGAVKVRVV